MDDARETKLFQTFRDLALQASPAPPPADQMSTSERQAASALKILGHFIGHNFESNSPAETLAGKTPPAATELGDEVLGGPRDSETLREHASRSADIGTVDEIVSSLVGNAAATANGLPTALRRDAAPLTDPVLTTPNQRAERASAADRYPSALEGGSISRQAWLDTDHLPTALPAPTEPDENPLESAPAGANPAGPRLEQTAFAASSNARAATADAESISVAERNSRAAGTATAAQPAAPDDDSSAGGKTAASGNLRISVRSTIPDIEESQAIADQSVEPQTEDAASAIAEQFAAAVEANAADIKELKRRMEQHFMDDFAYKSQMSALYD